MKRLKIKVLTKINLLLGALVALLGCHSSKQVAVSDRIMCLYGVPSATYKVSGKVTNSQNKPVQDAQVVVKGYKNLALTDTVRTDKKGRYAVDCTGFPADELNIVVLDSKGEYQTDSVQIEVPEKEGSSVFDQGEYTFKKDIQLK